MSLKSRVTKIESVAGQGRSPSEAEFVDAVRLQSRHYTALRFPEIASRCGMKRPADPKEVALMRAAEQSGQIEAACDVERRYWRARGVNLAERERQGKLWAEQYLQELRNRYQIEQQSGDGEA